MAGAVNKEDDVLKGGCRDGRGLIRMALWATGRPLSLIEHCAVSSVVIF